MMSVEYMHQILWELKRVLWVTVCNVSKKVDQVSNRDDAIVCRGGWCLQEYVPVVLILAVLIQKVLFVGTIQLSALDKVRAMME